MQNTKQCTLCTAQDLNTLFSTCSLGSPLNNGDIFSFNKYVHLFLCNEDYSVATQ